jgi:hypothetical protein
MLPDTEFFSESFSEFGKLRLIDVLFMQGRNSVGPREALAPAFWSYGSCVRRRKLPGLWPSALRAEAGSHADHC